MIGNDWDEKLNIVWQSNGFKKFLKIVEHEYETKTIFPPKNYIFNALKLTPYSNTKVVIVGQDPYHGEGEAHGLSFSVQKGVKIPPSLQNIYKELKDDLNIPIAHTGDLTKWGKEGVLLLNTALTCEVNKPGSHSLLWRPFICKLIKQICSYNPGTVWLLLGNSAQSFEPYISKSQYIIKAKHPAYYHRNHEIMPYHIWTDINKILVGLNGYGINFYNEEYYE